VKLKNHLVPSILAEAEWNSIVANARRDVEAAVERALARPSADGASVTRHRFCEIDANGRPQLQEQGGIAPDGLELPQGSREPRPEPTRSNMITAIRRTLDVELAVNPRLAIFGEDVGPKGGVHGVTLGMQEKFGRERVFDTSLSEEGIIGRAVGMALAGLTPVPEIQFRKYAEPATEQLHDCGTLRWRTGNRFAAPIVVRMPGGFGPKCGDPWHSQCNEAQFLHATGWRFAMPSNAEDAVGLLRTALRGNDPTIFFEHRALLDAAWSRRPYPGDDYMLPFGVARTIRAGDALTIVSWGAMVERCDGAIQASGVAAELIDLRTLSPWDRDAVLASVRRTRRCLIVHEDTMTAGFGAEIAAVVAKEAFFDLDAPIERMAMPDTPSPHNFALFEAAMPTVAKIAATIKAVTEI
jgi:2-oxoisovalerate dehydrogenase E1 component